MARRIYMDYASVTPLDKRVLKVMLPFMTDDFGNPSAIYTEGLKTKQAVKDARKKISEILNIRSEEIIFTASGTEADNLAVRGIYESWKNHFRPHIITTNIEHPGILEICKQIQREGAEVTYVPVSPDGIVDPEKIRRALKPTTVLVTVMYANNEIGTIQPLRDIARVVAEYKKEHNQYTAYPYFHTDASQAGNYLDLSFQKLGVDLMTLDASKFYGPKGVGLLAARRYVELKPLIYGGGQEKGLRSGSENVSGIVGMAEALKIAQEMKDQETKRLEKLQDYFIENVIKEIPGVIINGHRNKRLPNNVNICSPHLEAEFAVIKLDQLGISCSAASSCLNLSEEPYSYVIEALGEEGKRCKGCSLRFTFGRNTKKKEVDLTLRQLASIMIRQ